VTTELVVLMRVVLLKSLLQWGRDQVITELNIALRTGG
jgi:hypothetical protein